MVSPRLTPSRREAAAAAANIADDAKDELKALVAGAAGEAGTISGDVAPTTDPIRGGALEGGRVGADGRSRAGGQRAHVVVLEGAGDGLSEKVRPVNLRLEPRPATLCRNRHSATLLFR